METEKFELMLDEAQANAALEKGMLYADTFVNKNYLINLDRYPLVELDSAEKSDEYIRLYQIERIVYDVDENANDKLISVYSASGQVLCSVNDIDEEYLFDQNTIVDLSRVSSLETKSLLMGVLILKLNEYRMCTSEENQPLRHVTVMEEKIIRTNLKLLVIASTKRTWLQLEIGTAVSMTISIATFF